ncbi:MAG: WD40 repeat domain-containing protein [Cyanobacteria bacterium J06628_6]
MIARSRSKPHTSGASSDYRRHWQGRLADYVTALAWSPNGAYLAVSASSGQVMLWSEGEPRWLLPETAQPAIDCLSFSGDGRYLAAAGQQGTVFVWQIDGSDGPIAQLDHPHVWIDRLVWHPLQPLLAFGTGTQVRFWGQGALPAPLDFVDSSVLSLAWHPRGHHLAVSGHTGVKVWRSDDWESPPEFIEVPGASLSVAWSGDGRYLASGNLDRTLTVLDWGKPPPWLMQGFPGKVRQVTWVSTGGSIGVSTGSVPQVAAACLEGVTVWRRQGQSWESRVLTAHADTVVAIATHPTRPLLASAAKDGQLCLWKNAATRQQTIRGKAEFSTLAWHPQGTYLAAGDSQGSLTLWKAAQRGRGFQR